MYQSDDYYRKMLMNTWFEKQVKKYQFAKNGKFCDCVLLIKYYPFFVTFSTAYKKNIAHYDTPTDCYSDCMMLMWEGICKFELMEGATWKDLAEGKDKKNYGRLVRYLDKYVAKEMNWLNSDYVETTKLTIDDEGERHITHVFYRVTPASIHHLVLPKGASERVEVGETVEDSYWNDSRKAKCSLFHEWLYTRAIDELKKPHIKLLKKLRDANYSSYDRPAEPYEKVDTRNLKSRLKKIYEWLTKKYMEEEKFLNGGFVLRELRNEYKTLAKYMSILNNPQVEDDDIASRLAEHVLDSMNNDYWIRLIYDILSSESEQAIIQEFQRTSLIHEDNFRLYGKRRTLSNSVLNEVTKAVITRLSELERAIEKEEQYLTLQGEKKSMPVELMHFKLPKKGENKMVYLDVAPNGIMYQRDARNDI